MVATIDDVDEASIVMSSSAADVAVLDEGVRAGEHRVDGEGAGAAAGAATDATDADRGRGGDGEGVDRGAGDLELPGGRAQDPVTEAGLQVTQRPLRPVDDPGDGQPVGELEEGEGGVERSAQGGDLDRVEHTRVGDDGAVEQRRGERWDRDRRWVEAAGGDDLDLTHLVVGDGDVLDVGRRRHRHPVAGQGHGDRDADADPDPGRHADRRRQDDRADQRAVAGDDLQVVAGDSGVDARPSRRRPRRRP